MSERLRIFQVDAFTLRPFHGNPAAIVPLERWLDDADMQAIAAENNLAETAFFVPEGDGFRLRWFTPAVEIDLCGHATLTTAWVLFEKLGYRGERILFETLSGLLTVTRKADQLWLDFPARPGVPVDPPPALLEAIGRKPERVLKARDFLMVYPSAGDVLRLDPDMLKLRRITDAFAVIVTAPGDDCDFVSRFFAPAQGIPEDPVTGSAHCTLIPYWAQRLGKNALFARQVSPRGGELWCELRGDRVGIGGQAVLYLEGEICV